MLICIQARVEPVVGSIYRGGVGGRAADRSPNPKNEELTFN